jgi:hypothetical protein
VGRLGGELLYQEFKTAVQQQLEAPSTGGGLVPIPAIRRALADHVSAAEFDVLLCAMQRDGLVHLLTHVEPERLPPQERDACLVHPSGVVAYWVCGV